MSKMYVYALYTYEFESQDDFKSGNPVENYFYVGRTKNIERRKQQHQGDARRGSNYPYHEKIRTVDFWDIEELASVDESEISDHEEYFMMKLTCDGHPLLNLRRGDSVRKRANEFMSELKNANVKSSSEYRQLVIDAQKEKIHHRERMQISKQLRHIKYDPQTEEHTYDLNGKLHVTEKYISKDEVIDMLRPSANVELIKLVRKVKLLASELKQ